MCAAYASSSRRSADLPVGSPGLASALAPPVVLPTVLPPPLLPLPDAVGGAAGGAAGVAPGAGAWPRTCSPAKSGWLGKVRLRSFSISSRCSSPSLAWRVKGEGCSDTSDFGGARHRSAGRPVAWPLPQMCRASRSRQVCPEEPREPSSGAAKGALCPCCRAPLRTILA